MNGVSSSGGPQYIQGPSNDTGATGAGASGPAGKLPSPETAKQELQAKPEKVMTGDKSLVGDPNKGLEPFNKTAAKRDAMMAVITRAPGAFAEIAGEIPKDAKISDVIALGLSHAKVKQ